jgi:outer membrane protein assembly factor BamE (lipoprotein component of BamABCDE complex)
VKGGRFVKRIIPVVLYVLVSFAQGCAFVRGNLGDELSAKDIESLRNGVTTREEVAKLLGAPDRIVQVNSHDVFQYYRYDIKSATVLFFSRTNIKTDDLYVFFNKDHLVDDVVFGRRTGRLEFQFWPFGD